MIAVQVRIAQKCEDGEFKTEDISIFMRLKAISNK
jgi:hypothetical protein